MPKSENTKYEYRPTIGHDIHGKPIRKSFYGKTKKAAKAKAEQWLIDNAMGIQEQTNRVLTLKEVYADYMAHKESTIRPISFYQLKSQFRCILDEFGDVPINRIKHNDIIKFVDKLCETYAQNTVAATKTNLSGLMRYAVRCEYISTNPCEGVGFRSKNKTKPREVYTKEEAEQIIEYSRIHPLGLCVDIMLSYGTTISETLGITYDAVNFEEKTIDITQGVTAVPGQIVTDVPKNDFRVRTICVSDATLEHIQKVHDKRYKFLIHNDDENFEAPMAPHWFRNHVYNIFMDDMVKYYALKGTDIRKLRPHELRHTRATILVEDDINLFAIAEQFGWSDLKMIRQIYGHPSVSMRRKMLRME